MEQTPRANRIHIGIYGRCNSGKSSLINAITGQQTAVVSEVAGTTTDTVNKSMELPGVGAVTFIDTAGFDDTGELVAAHNGYGLEGEVRGPVVGPGRHELELRITCPGDDLWDLAVAVDGEAVAAGTGFRLLMAMAPFEGIDVGIDRRSPVSWAVYERHGSFPFSGTIRSVSYRPGEPAPDSPTNFLDFLREWGRSME